MAAGLFARKSIDQFVKPASQAGLKRSMGPLDVTLLGIGAIIGGGIFATIGSAAIGGPLQPGAGPSLMLSFVVTALVCALTAMAYAELACLVPVSGSAYTYAYTALGELVAWVMGWTLLLEYSVSNVAVAISWAHYGEALLLAAGIRLPFWLTTDLRSSAADGTLAQAPHLFGVPIVINILAALIIGLLTCMLVRGMRESVRLNNFFVLLKIAVLLLFVIIALTYVGPTAMAGHYSPFFPNGWRGTASGAAVVFFAYIGFDAVSTVAEEARQPSRTLPLGIMGSLAACALLYVLVAAAFTGLLPYARLTHLLAQGSADPLSVALVDAAPSARWALVLVTVGALVAQTTALLAFQVAQARLFYAMARDGLLPKRLAALHPRHKTPAISTYAAGLLVGGAAAFARLDEMVDLTNIGTLFVFMLVCLSVPILRHIEPKRTRAFRVPFGPHLIPLCGAASCLGLMACLPANSWLLFLAYLAAGTALYALYGFRHSDLMGLARKQQSLNATRLMGAGWGGVAAGLLAFASQPPSVVWMLFMGGGIASIASAAWVYARPT